MREPEHEAMETVIFLAHVGPDGSLDRHALEALGAAKALVAGLPGSTLMAGLSGGSSGAAAVAIAGCGAVRLFVVEGPDFAEPRYATDAIAAEALCRTAKATIAVAPSTSRWSRVLGGVAHRLGGRFDAHLTGLSAEGGKVTASRWYYRQRIEAAIARAGRPWLVTVEPGCFEPFAGTGGTARIEAVAVEVPAEAERTRSAGVRSAGGGGDTIRPDSKLLFVAGAGWTKKQADGKAHIPEAEKTILGFLRASGASLGSSKSLVDLSGEGQAVLPFMSHLNQVGQTGSTPRHPKGLVTCCHGEEPHVVGWRFIRERRAVNLDPGCGWARGKADVVYVADAFDVMAKVIEILEGRGKS
jgi:electron transfer flavoprotein alpha subunit